MAGTFRFELVSPERLLLSVDAEQVGVPGADGDFTVLANHAPVLSTLRPGILDVVAEDARKRLFVLSGFAEVEPDRLTVLAERAYDVDEFDAAQIADELEMAKAQLDSAKDDETRAMAARAIEQLKALGARAS